MKRRIAILAVAAFSAVFIAALPAQSRTAAVKTTKITVTAGKPSEFRFILSKKTVPHGVVVFTVTNKGSLPHDFKIMGKKTPLLSPGKKATLKVTFKKKGLYPYLCTVAGHAAAGMKGKLKVT